ncbi:WD40 repeat domain-containing protein [Nocardioides euryhalodurans]|uniref:WD40 repeat domain-containing protein n=1 Tax=Nocardioides euryhalodurans TaxID=2518370 RepID=A0A4P7GK64_9ACTN|nr:WD40 repeat domain-containing protein [Nocardioides euryhalodurans]QBR92406.1 WD40 repeat domain-containing protein [Nocardioides euryhalodurans]
MVLREVAAALLVALPFGIGASAATEGDRPLFRFADPEITESSGLVVADDLVVTVNDSGDEARVFVVDPATGETVGVTRWVGEPVDVEALAPAGPGEVWVADIGDNAGERATTRVTRVPVARGDRAVEGEALDLVLPGGPTDAEALLVHPRSGRLLVATKGILGGELLAAATDLGSEDPLRLRSLGAVMPLVTDGAFFPDGRHLVLRDYGRAMVLAWPSLRIVGEVSLPPSEQGEGIAVTEDDRLLVSSEGVRAPVHEVALPPDLVRAMAPAPGRSSDASDSPSPSAPEQAPPQPAPRRDPWPWLLGGLVGGVMLVVLLRSLRPR